MELPKFFLPMNYYRLFITFFHVENIRSDNPTNDCCLYTLHISAFSFDKYSLRKVIYCINLFKWAVVRLTGIDSLSILPPLRLPFWKFLGKTFLPNLWFLSLFHEMPFLFTGNCSLLREKMYVSLNKLQAMRPHGTIALPLTISSGLQLLVSFSPLGLLNCSSLRLFTYLNYGKYNGIK